MGHYEHLDERDGVWEAMKARRAEHLGEQDREDGERAEAECVDQPGRAEGGDSK